MTGAANRFPIGPQRLRPVCLIHHLIAQVSAHPTHLTPPLLPTRTSAAAVVPLANAGDLHAQEGEEEEEEEVEKEEEKEEEEEYELAF